MLKPMKFKDYVWPHNPSTYNMDYNKNLITHEYPGINGAETEDLGSQPRVVSGTGAFYGKDAYKQFSKLVALYYENTPGTLIHPIWQPMTARFTKLKSNQEPTPNYVSYDFEFIEHREIFTISSPYSSSNNGNSSTSSSKASRTHIVKSGENLSKISQLYYGTQNKWRDIANANKKLIKNPNYIMPGWKLIIP